MPRAGRAGWCLARLQARTPVGPLGARGPALARPRVAPLYRRPSLVRYEPKVRIVTDLASLGGLTFPALRRVACTLRWSGRGSRLGRGRLTPAYRHDGPISITAWALCLRAINPGGSSSARVADDAELSARSFHAGRTEEPRSAWSERGARGHAPGLCPGVGLLALALVKPIAGGSAASRKAASTNSCLSPINRSRIPECKTALEICGGFCYTVGTAARETTLPLAPSSAVVSPPHCRRVAAIGGLSLRPVFV